MTSAVLAGFTVAFAITRRSNIEPGSIMETAVMAARR